MNGRTIVVGTIAAVLVVISIIFYFANLEQIDATTEGVVVQKPYIFGNDGVDMEPLYTGRHFIWPSEELVKYNAAPETVPEEFKDLPSSDNVQMDFRIHTVFELIKGSAPNTHDTVGHNWYSARIEEPYRTIIRDKVTRLTADTMRLNIGNKLRDTEIEIQRNLEKLLADAGIKYRVVSVSIGGVTPPEEVLEEAAKTAAQVQRQKTEEQRNLAEITRKEAEESRALADNAYRNQMSLNPAQFVTMQGFEAYKYAAEKCSASQGCTMIVGEPGMSPVLSVK